MKKERRGKMKTEYRNVSRSKRLIKEAVTKLLCEKDISKIRITEVTALADINRGTFYAHYRDVYDVVEQMQNEFVEVLCNSIHNYPPLSLLENPLPFIVEVGDYVRENMELYQILIQKDGDSQIFKKMNSIFIEKLFSDASYVPKEIDVKELKLCLSYIMGGCMGILGRWFNSEISYTFDELVLLLNDFVAANLSKYELPKH